jgi:hypothetical protein
MDLQESASWSPGRRRHDPFGALGGVLDGTVTEIGITCVHLHTGEGMPALPASQVPAAAVGPHPAEIPGRPGWPGFAGLGRI